ncbi:hypothetical protein ORV05_04880 [Amycolatopsis cynarae]|uniref:MbtH family NRPS accessory protein n=1 Tax=Amycolatopsis cynarae TaxID=2995223 RepID=A0ABY7B8D3_9PSEU|nr:hypothetical protein [Amycolatopsis sp. HUAS 11-8]WAL67126.1 hypothetical protein ORV05_04880 [Amycolatopsis sp. HUAS 11-8]
MPTTDTDAQPRYVVEERADVDGPYFVIVDTETTEVVWYRTGFGAVRPGTEQRGDRLCCSRQRWLMDHWASRINAQKD